MIVKKLSLLLPARRFFLLCSLNLPLRFHQLVLRRHVHHHQVEHILAQQALARLLIDALCGFLGRFALCALVAAAGAQPGFTSAQNDYTVVGIVII